MFIALSEYMNFGLNFNRKTLSDLGRGYGHGKALSGRFSSGKIPLKNCLDELVKKQMPNKFTERHTKRQKEVGFYKRTNESKIV